MTRRLLLVPLLFTLGCASAGAAGAAGSGAASRRSQSVITEAEIAENTGILNVYDLVVRVRPNYLRGTTELTGGSQPVQLRVDNNAQRDLADMKNIDVRQVHEIRYFSPQEASVRFGVDTNVPVISITMKRLK